MEISELIYMVRQKDEQATHELMTHFGGLMHYIVNQYVANPRLKMLKEDLLQECRITLLDAANAFDEHANVQFVTFLSTCLRRKVQSELRKQEIRLQGESISLEDLQEAYTDGNIASLSVLDDPSQHLYYQEMLADLKRYIASLSIMDLKICESMTKKVDIQQMAETMHISYSNLCNRRSRLRHEISQVVYHIGA